VPNASYFEFKVWAGNPLAKPKNDPFYTPIPFPAWWYHN